MVKDSRDNTRNEKRVHNGFDHDRLTEQATSQSASRRSGQARSDNKYMSGIDMSELRGFGYLLGGMLLFLYPLRLFPMLNSALNWAFMVAGIVAAVYGANNAQLWQKVVSAYNYVKSIFTSDKRDTLGSNKDTDNNYH